jgi:hypothetical protein
VAFSGGAPSSDSMGNSFGTCELQRHVLHSFQCGAQDGKATLGWCSLCLIGSQGGYRVLEGQPHCLQTLPGLPALRMLALYVGRETGPCFPPGRASSLVSPASWPHHGCPCEELCTLLMGMQTGPPGYSKVSF